MKIEDHIPAIKWLRDYKWGDFKNDFSAGLLVAVMLIPQSMAYAMLAGLPPVIGLYASTLPLIVYALFGSSRHLAVGPVAIVSLLVYVGCSQIATPGSSEYVKMVLLLTLFVGIVQFLLGSFKIGFITNFISHAVVSGFTSAGAVIICLSQIKYLLGIKIPGAHTAVQGAVAIMKEIGNTHFLTLIIGILCIIMLIVTKRKFSRVPGSLLLIATSIGAVYFFHLDTLGVSIVGNIPRGLPSLSVPAFSLQGAKILSTTVFTIVFVGFMESISIAQFVAAKNRYKVDADQELKALGLSNIASAFFSGYPVTGGFSRTAVNFNEGARTNLSSVITSLIIILSLLFLTPLFYYLSNVVLASIIIVAVLGLIDIKTAVHLFKIKATDGWLLLTTFFVTLFVGIEQGIISGVALSLLVFIWRSARPRIAELGYLKDEEAFHDRKFYPQAKTFPEILLLRTDASLYFANMRFVENWLRKHIAERNSVKWVVMDFSGVNDIDAVSVNYLEEIMQNYNESGVEFIFAGMKAQIRNLLHKAGWQDKYQGKIDFPTLKHALHHLKVV